MNICDIKPGMTIRVSNDLSKTIKKFGYNPLLKSMKGKIYKITTVNTTSVTIFIKGFHMTFLPEDISPIYTKEINPGMKVRTSKLSVEISIEDAINIINNIDTLTKTRKDSTIFKELQMLADNFQQYIKENKND